LLPLAMLKPNIGASVLLMRWPGKRAALFGGAVFLVSLLILPSWPIDWLRNTRQHDNFIPLLSLPGALLPLALLRWREPRARLLLGMACVPQRFNDVLMLWAIPETPRGGLILSILSWRYSICPCW
jgi:hypothetical protein